MIRFFLLLSLVLLGNVAIAQTPTLQTAKESWGEEGDVIYSYYVAPNGDEIKQGNFKLTRSDKLSNGGTYLRVVSGNFKNGYKDGLWTYTHNRKDYGSNNYYATGVVKLVQRFKEGIPHALWSYNCNVKYRQLLYNGSGYSWGGYIDPELVNVSCTYNNGKISGQLVYKTDKHNFKGNFNSNGYCVGDWVIRDEFRSTRFTSRNGFLTMYNHKGVNETLSEVINFSPQIINIVDSINAGTLSINDLPNRELQMDTVELSSIVMDLYTYMNGNQYFPMYLLGKGDKTYQDGYSSERSYGEFIIIKPLDKIEPNRMTEYNEILSSNDHASVINALASFYHKYEKRLSKSGKIHIIDNIENRKYILEEQIKKQKKLIADQKAKEMEEKYEALYTDMTKLIKPSKKKQKKYPFELNDRNFTRYGYLQEQYSEDYSMWMVEEFCSNGKLKLENHEVSLSKLREYINYLQQFQKK